MTDIEQPLFRSVEDALKFAYADDYDAVARSLMSRMADGPSRTGRGLQGVDGFAQAGLILAAVSKLDVLHADILIARFSPIHEACDCGSACCMGYRHQPRWLSAAIRIVEHVAQELPESRSPYLLRDRAVRLYFGEKRGMGIGETADACRMHRNTASVRVARIKDMLKSEERQARYGIMALLEGSGLIDAS